MGYIVKVDRHRCEKPNAEDSRAGDVWQCDYCKKFYICQLFGWMFAYQTVDRVWKAATPENKNNYPEAENPVYTIIDEKHTGG